LIGEVVDARAVLSEFATTQARLCDALIDHFGLADEKLPLEIPWSGAIAMGGEQWLFQKHGVGVRFRRASDSSIYDAHTHMRSCSDCFDVWRLEQYFDSRRVPLVNVGMRIFETQSASALNALLAELSMLGVIASVGHNNLYRLSAV
jgi:hypothetical protein